jgi:hypothetical protein
MKRTAMLALLGLASWSAQADHDVPGWRIGAAASFSDFEWRDGEFDLIKDSAVGVKLFTQYQFNSWLGIEGAYHNTGDFEELSTAPAPNDGNLDLQFDGFSVAAIGYLPVESEGIRLYGKAGLYDFDSEISRNGVSGASGSENGLMFGAGAAIDVSDRFGIRADFDWFDAEVGDLWAVNLGIEYFFGGSGKSSAGQAPQIPPPPQDLEPADVGAESSPDMGGDAAGDITE